MIALTDPNYGRMPLSDNSLTLGAVISKNTRHRLCVLCLREIKRELNKNKDNPHGDGNFPSHKRRGRPQSTSTILAIQIGVSYDTIMRWRDPEAIQACDANAMKLARIALTYNPEETIEILRGDLELRQVVVENWISQMTALAHTNAGAYVENKRVTEGVR